MPGREDFGIVRTRFLIDERAHAAAREYVNHDLAVTPTALATVAGHIAMLGAYAARETDNGVLTRFAIQAALATTPDVAQGVIEALVEAALLRKRRGEKWYLVGFKDCYEPIVSRRSNDAARKREERRTRRSSLKTSAGRPQDVSRTSGRTSADSDPVRSGTVRRTPPPPCEGGEDRSAITRKNGTLRPRELQRYERVLDYVVRCGTEHPNSPDGRRRDVAVSRRRALRNSIVTDEQIAEQLANDYAWVTPERLARFEDNRPRDASP